MSSPSSPSYTNNGGEPSQSNGALDHHTRTLSNEENLLEEDGDDVFSNPDTAELESSRSDATGATSPTPNSPGPSSPSNRGSSHIAIIASQHQLDPFGTLKQNEYNNGQTKQAIHSLTLADLPSTNPSQLQHPFEQSGHVETPKATPNSNTASPNSSMRPHFSRTLSASGAATMQSSGLISGNASRVTTPRLGGHASSHSTSYLNLSSLHGHPLPSAHDMPSDPKEASTLSKLFARPPAQSPSEEINQLSFGMTPESGNMFRSSTSGPATPLASASPVTTSRLRSRPTTRPSSPDRYSSPPRGFNAGLGLGHLPKTNNEVESSEPSIFERDIEHRDAGHVLSKQEAIDVAIPSVLDDAVEAITCEDADQVEIVSPHAATPMLALSAQALSAHSHSHGRTQTSQISSTSSPAHSPSPPLSSAGGVEAPPGTMAAQIAERLATKAGSSSPEDVTTTPPALHNAISRHRRPMSDVSSNSSMRSRSPQVPLSIGVQQVLDASNNSMATRSLSTSPGAAIVGHSKSTSLATTPRSGSMSHSNLTLLASQAASGSPTQTTTALPSLPLPNPFRSHSPTTSTLSPLADGGMPMLSSVSMDGAVMNTSDSATMDASLDGLADVIASSQIGSRRVSGASTVAMSSPLGKFKTLGLGLEDDVGPYSSRSPGIGNSASPIMSRDADRSMPGGFSLDSPSDDPLSSSRAAKSSGSSTVAKKRLSFFSYADIINKTPAEVLDFDSALRQADEATHNSNSMNRSFSSGPNILSSDR